MTIVITNCTNRKRGVAHPSLNQSNISPGSLEFVLDQWVDSLKNDHDLKLASDIYCGRGFREAEATSRILNCPLYIVSAGLGIINSNSSVPIYNLTASTKQEGSVLRKIQDGSTAIQWWSNISGASPFGTSLQRVMSDHPDDLILIALPATYFELIKDDLLRCPYIQQPRLRFFGKNLDSILPNSLKRNWMPYDDRLDGIGVGHSGTQSDFAQRAMRHFALTVLDQCREGSANTHSDLVIDSISPIGRRPIPKRDRLNDLEIGKAVSANWIKGKGQSSLLLRIIRDDLNIACEQKRFTRILNSVKQKIGGAI